MYNPEIRYLIDEDNDNRELLMPYLLDGYVFAAFTVCGVGLIVVCGLIPLFKITSLILIQLSHLLEYLWTIFWNVLTPGNQLLDIAIMVTSIVAFSALIHTMEGVSDQLDKSFKKLKTDLAERNKKISELELEILKMKESLQETTKKSVEHEKDKVDPRAEDPRTDDPMADDNEVDKQILETWFENCLVNK